MAYRYKSRRSVKRLARKSRRNFILTLIIVVFLIYSTFTWLLPSLINGLGLVKSIIKPSQKILSQPKELLGTLAPPVLNIPYEATNTAQIDIRGYATPNSKVKIYLDDEPKQTVSVLDDGSFEIANVILSLGTNNIYGTTINDQDKESLPSKTIRLIYDNEKPVLEIFEPEDGKNIEGGGKKVKVRGKSEPQAKVFVNDTLVVVSSDGTFNMDYPLNEGDNIITIKSVDRANNSTETVRRVTFKP